MTPPALPESEGFPANPPFRPYAPAELQRVDFSRPASPIPPDSDEDEFDETDEPEEEEHEEEEQDPGPSLRELHDDILAGNAESVRANRRMIEFLKQFGTLLNALSSTVNDSHRSLRTLQSSQVNPASNPVSDLALPLVEVADRISRVLEGFETAPPPVQSWWPGGAKSSQPWQSAWTRQREAVSILHGHMLTLLNRAGITRMNPVGQAFDPNAMIAVESVTDPSKPDHTVLAELLPGWVSSSGSIVRPAQVRVSRSQKA